MEVGSRGIEQALLNNEPDVGVLLQPLMNKLLIASSYVTTL